MTIHSTGYVSSAASMAAAPLKAIDTVGLRVWAIMYQGTLRATGCALQHSVELRELRFPAAGSSHRPAWPCSTGRRNRRTLHTPRTAAPTSTARRRDSPRCTHASSRVRIASMPNPPARTNKRRRTYTARGRWRIPVRSPRRAEVASDAEDPDQDLRQRRRQKGPSAGTTVTASHQSMAGANGMARKVPNACVIWSVDVQGT